MDTKKFLIGTLVGGIAHFFLGYLIYGVTLTGFFTSHMGPSAGQMNTEMVWWALILGDFAAGAMLTYIFLKWAHITTFGGGASAAATIGFLLALSMDMIRFGTSNAIDLTGALGDVGAETILNALVGGVIGAVLGMGKKG